MLSRLSPIPASGAPLPPCGGDEGRSALVSSQGADRHILQAHDRGARVVEALYRENGSAADHFGTSDNDSDLTAFRPVDVLVRSADVADRSAPGGADRSFEPGELPAFLRRPRAEPVEDTFWREPGRYTPDTRLLGRQLAFRLSLILAATIVVVAVFAYEVL